MAKNHRKPTIKELDESINATLKDLESNPEETPEVPDIPDPAVKTEEPEETPENPPEEKKEAPEEEKEQKPVEKKVTEEKKEPVSPDYEKRYRDSSTEAQLLYAKNKKITDAIEKASDIAEPTDEEVAGYVQSLGEDWETLSTFEQKMAKQNLISSRKDKAIQEATREFKDMDEWNGKIDEFLTDPKTLIDHPELEGRESDFRIFSLKPTRKGIDFGDLVSAFLYSQSGKPAKKGQMFETGTGGAKEKGKQTSDKISVEESRRLRQVDYKKYLEYVRAGKVEDTV